MSEDNLVLVELGKRKYLNPRILNTYFFPSDTTEYSRQCLKHNLYYYWLNCNHSCITFSENTLPKKILDIGVGSGVWIMDFQKSLASKFSEEKVNKIQFFGLDVVKNDTYCNNINSYKFIKFNLLNISSGSHLPFGNNEIDFIHIRDLLSSLPVGMWETIFSEFYRVLTPEGKIEIVDTNPLVKEITSLQKSSNLNKNILIKKEFSSEFKNIKFPSPRSPLWFFNEVLYKLYSLYGLSLQTSSNFSEMINSKEYMFKWNSFNQSAIFLKSPSKFSFKQNDNKSKQENHQLSANTLYKENTRIIINDVRFLLKNIIIKTYTSLSFVMKSTNSINDDVWAENIEELNNYLKSGLKFNGECIELFSCAISKV